MSVVDRHLYFHEFLSNDRNMPDLCYPVGTYFMDSIHKDLSLHNSFLNLLDYLLFVDFHWVLLKDDLGHSHVPLYLPVHVLLYRGRSTFLIDDPLFYLLHYLLLLDFLWNLHAVRDLHWHLLHLGNDLFFYHKLFLCNNPISYHFDRHLGVDLYNDHFRYSHDFCLLQVFDFFDFD